MFNIYFISICLLIVEATYELKIQLNDSKYNVQEIQIKCEKMFLVELNQANNFTYQTKSQTSFKFDKSSNILTANLEAIDFHKLPNYNWKFLDQKKAILANIFDIKKYAIGSNIRCTFKFKEQLEKNNRKSWALMTSDKSDKISVKIRKMKNEKSRNIKVSPSTQKDSKFQTSNLDTATTTKQLKNAKLLDEVYQNEQDIDVKDNDEQLKVENDNFKSNFSKYRLVHTLLLIGSLITVFVYLWVMIKGSD